MARLSPTSARPLLELGHEDSRPVIRAPTRAILSLSSRRGIVGGGCRGRKKCRRVLDREVFRDDWIDSKSCGKTRR